ncbi:hypothetical protein, partial [Mesorhizobium sp. LSJC264A00]|uniref:hypothetical protein n=1 Tax=Mesorhizobium sp. LSJC264A00 TaxID=1287321 RepID=UPI001AEC2DB3
HLFRWTPACIRALNSKRCGEIRAYESAVTVNSMTIGGVAATLLAQVESIFNSGVVYLSVWSALVPTGTTATIVTTYSESVFRDYMSVYTTTNWDGVVGTVASDNNSTGGLTTTVSIGALGAAIAIAGNATKGASALRH